MKSFVYRYIQYLIAVFIAWFEGYFISGTRAHRNNNPGNLRGWSKALPKDNQGFDIFPHHVDGWDALFRQVELNIDRELSVMEFFCGKEFVYAGYSHTDCRQYAEFIARRTGLAIANVSILNQISRIQRIIDERRG